MSLIGTSVAEQRERNMNIMAKATRAAADRSLDLDILRFCSMAVDLRRQITPDELERIPSLAHAFDACDTVLEQLGWGKTAPQSKSNGRRTG
jgi:hypothetical protein